MTAPATLLLAHSLPYVLMMWRNLLTPYCERYHIAGEAATTQQMLKAAATLQPAFVIMDAAIGGNCIATTVQKLQAFSNVKVIVCWRYIDESLVQQIPGLHVAYIAEDASLSQMLTALKELTKGKTYYCSQTERLFSQPAAGNLPKRYHRILRSMRLGHSAQDMTLATRLKLNAVNSYIKEIRALIGSRSMVALESFMKKHGML